MIQDQKFGVEIELTGLTRERAAEVIADYFGTSYYHTGGCYDTYSVRDNAGRTWKVVKDASIDCTDRNGNEAGSAYSVEFVTPICVYEDIPTIQQLARELRYNGALANNSCGIHVHVNGAPYDARSLRNLTNIMRSKEDLIYKALKVDPAREHRYCKKVDEDFLEELNRKKPKTLDKIQNIWYHGNDGSNTHYHSSRYTCLNLHSLFSKGTIEFRLFNSTTHAGRIKAYIQFCLAISNQALNQSCASYRKMQSTNEKYTFRTWLLRLGMIGDEFKTARKFLLENLDGCIAWKDPAQALEQRERLKQARQKESAQEQSKEQEEQPSEEPEQTSNADEQQDEEETMPMGLAM